MRRHYARNTAACLARQKRYRETHVEQYRAYFKARWERVKATLHREAM